MSCPQQFCSALVNTGLWLPLGNPRRLENGIAIVAEKKNLINSLKCLELQAEGLMEQRCGKEFTHKGAISRYLNNAYAQDLSRG